MRKLVYGALALTAAFTLSVGSVAATEGDPTLEEPTAPAAGISVTSNGDTLTISAASAKQIMVGTASAKAVKGKTTKTLKVSAWDTYDVAGGVVKVDLSKIATTKDAYLRIKADGQTPDQGITLKLPKTDVKLKAKYDKGKGTITLSNGKEAYKNATVIWRTANSDYEANATTDANGVVSEESSLGAELERYRMSGGTIYMCVPEQAAAAAATEEAAAESFVEEDGTTAITVQTLGARRSKEAKVTIGKRANAPKVSVNYVKGEITIPKKAQYRITKYDANGAATGSLGDFSAALNDKKVLSLAQEEGEDVIVANTPFAVDVVTPGDGDKKADSKVGHTTFSAQEPTDYADSVKVDVVAIKKKTDVVNITVENKSQTETYTFFIGTAAKGVTVKPGKSGTLKNVTIAATTTISVQRVGDKKTETWAGNKTAGVGLETFTGKTLDEIKEVAAGEGGSTGGEDKPVQTFEITIEDAAKSRVASISVNGQTVEETTAIPKDADVVVTTVPFATVTCDGVSASNSTDSSNVTTYSFKMPAGNVTIKVPA